MHHALFYQKKVETQGWQVGLIAEIRKKLAFLADFYADSRPLGSRPYPFNLRQSVDRFGKVHRFRGLNAGVSVPNFTTIRTDTGLQFDSPWSSMPVNYKTAWAL
jgi:hypothetical protein